jgi:transglutaminase-like putative cysteine protease
MLLRFPAMRAGFLSILAVLLGTATPFREASPNGAVCLIDSTEINVKNNHTAVVKVHRAFAITSEAGLRFAQVIIPINDFIEVRDIKGYTELPGGTRIKLTKQDVGTSSAPAFKGFGDTQVITFSLRTPVVGSKVYYEYKQVVKSLLYLPRIARNLEYPTNRMVVNLRWGKKAKISYQSGGLTEFPGERIVKFAASDLSEQPREPQPCPDPIFVAISSRTFSYNKSNYVSAGWSDVGSFFARLSTQPEDFQEELKALASRLTESALSRSESLAALYNFLADSVSYVALEVGKGDFTPHVCSVILNRRFGDCKDQSVLLSSLCRAAGFDAHPALISTVGYPPIDELHPWPAWFDHVITVVKDEAGYHLLDPSDPWGSVDVIPPRLRGKSYLICDGVSGLKTTPASANPASTIVWQFYISRPQESGGLEVNFALQYISDAARAYRSIWIDKPPDETASALQSQFRYTGWTLSNLSLHGIEYIDDTLFVSGTFDLKPGESGRSKNLAIASPLNIYLLDNIFFDARMGDYCGAGSIRLDETVAIDMGITGITVGSPFSDSWKRAGLSFRDEMVVDRRRAVYHRSFDFSRENLPASDYNAFRDFLLSRIDQQYVRFQK